MKIRQKLFSRFCFATRADLAKLEHKIMAKVSELAGQLSALADEVDKIKAEVQTLQASLANVELPADAQASLDRLTAAVKAVDDLNPDAPATPPPTT